jgi:hypothetical protein
VPTRSIAMSWELLRLQVLSRLSLQAMLFIFLDEAADHKCTTKNKRCKDEELTFLYSVEFILRIREVHISSTLVKIFLLDGLLFYFLLTLYSSRCRNVIMLGVHSHILNHPAVFSREPSVRPRPLAH